MKRAANAANIGTTIALRLAAVTLVTETRQNR